jgi:hypothetical protein
LESPVLVRHDVGCKWGRFSGEVDARANVLSGGFTPGHSDAARRFSDVFNLHRSAGTREGWIAVRYSDGSSDDEVYSSREEAIRFKYPDEDWYFYCTLGAAPGMTICQAESLLRYKRIMSELDRPHADRDAPQGGREVISRLTNEDMEAQIRAVRSGRGMVAMGYRR